MSLPEFLTLLDELLEVPRRPRLLHAAVVHFPVALATLGVLPAALVVVAHRRFPRLHWTLAVLHGTAALAALVAAWSGEQALAGLGASSPAARGALATHQTLAVWVAPLCGLAAVSALAVAHRDRWVRRAGRWSSLASSVAVAGLVGVVGHLGGTAVHVHGAGTPHAVVGSEDTPDDPREHRFATEVRPLLERSCMGCHGPGEFAQGGLDLTTIDGALRGGARGPAVVPGRPEQSLLLATVRHADGVPAMPLGGKRLSDEEIRSLTAWVTEGAVWPRSR